MFEQLVRPFQSRQVTTTRRIVPAIRKPDEKPDEARITWGSAGKLPQGVVQPKSTNLENIEDVGFNVRGNIDNFNQTSRESDQIEVPIRDNSGAQIGTATIDRAREITYVNKNSKGEPYLPNFGYNQNYPSGSDEAAADFTGVDSEPPAGLRKNLPSSNVSRRTDRYTY